VATDDAPGSKGWRARRECAEYLKELEAPPGFEPGMEVLQLDLTSFTNPRKSASRAFLEQFCNLSSFALFASFARVDPVCSHPVHLRFSGVGGGQGSTPANRPHHQQSKGEQ